MLCWLLFSSASFLINAVSVKADMAAIKKFDQVLFIRSDFL